MSLIKKLFISQPFAIIASQKSVFSLIVFALMMQNIAAQKDSLKALRPKAKYDVWYFRHDENKLQGIDTSIFQLHRNDFVTRNHEEYLNLGNTGTAAYPLIFAPQGRNSFSAGFNQFNIYRLTPDSIKYYRAQRPYTELSYQIGLKNEQMFKGRFSHSTKSGLDYGTEFYRTDSKGSYQNQNSLNAGFYLYGKYKTKNERWLIGTDLIYNQFKVAENGGLTKDFFASDTTFFQKSLAPVNLASAVNNYREWYWNFSTAYNIGKKIKERKNDTLIIDKVIPRFRVGFDLSVESSKYKYLDKAPDSTYYQDYYYRSDSLVNSQEFFKVGNALSFTWVPQRRTSDTTYKEQFLYAGGAIHFDYWTAKDVTGKVPFINSFVDGFVRSNTAFKSPIHFDTRVRYYFSGYNLNDLSIKGKIIYAFKDFFSVNANVSYSLAEPAYTQQYFLVKNGAGWINNFKKQNELAIGGNVHSDKIGVGVNIYNTILQNYIYYNEQAKPIQIANAVNVFTAHFYNRFGFKGFHLDNDVWFQQASGTDAIRIPTFVSKHSIYYENRIFKKALWFVIGFDVRYNTPFNVNAYNPLIGQYYLQDKQKMKFTPGWNVFLNMKIKTLRVSLLGNNLAQIITNKPNYNTYLYPALDPSFRFFVAWRFLE